MEVKFISEFGILDLSKIQISTEESNSKTADSMFTKFTLPFDITADQEFIQKFGDYTSNESNSLKNKITGTMQFENKLHEAVMFIQSIIDDTLTAQIDFGFDELPNFDKKLSSLPLERFEIDDIHIYSKQIAGKQWPETNFNFPRIYSKKYIGNQPFGDFDGYYNDLLPDGSEMRRNYIDGGGTPRNINIIHPCPHPLYILMKGFEDAGYELEGDILTDPVLQKKWVFSGTEYFSRFSQKRYGLDVNGEDFAFYSGFVATYINSLTVEKKGKYKIVGYFNAKGIGSDVLSSIRMNGTLIWQIGSQYTQEQDLFFNIDLNIESDNTVLTFFHRRGYSSVSPTVIHVDLIGDELISGDTVDTGVITNKNEIDLARAVPDMTFGEYFNKIKNWFNYDLEIIDNRAIMNRIATEEISDVKDFTAFEAPKPKRTFANEKSWLLKFADLDGEEKKDSMFFDSSGQKLNGPEKEDTNVIEIDGYVLPQRLPKEFGYNTAYVLKDSSNTLSLVDYDGLKNNQNNANSATDCDFPQVFETHWINWLKLRLYGQEFNWNATVNIEKFSAFSIKNYIYAYNNVHIIKNWSKNKINPTQYEVDFTTETVS